MYKLCEKFGWTEREIKQSSFSFVNSMLEIMSIESKYIKWKKNGNK